MADKPCVMADGVLPDSIYRALEPHVELIAWTQRPGEMGPRVAGLFTYGHPLVDEHLLTALPRLRVISNHGVGVDHIDLSAASRRGIPVGNTPDVLDGAVADLAFALLLAAARRVVESAAVAAAPTTTAFDASCLHGQEVHGRTLGIVGLGRIGLQIARRGQGFDMPVRYYSRHRVPAAEQQLGVEYRDLSKLVGEADFLVLSVPLTDSTRGLIGADQFARMKPSSVLINVSRGPVVDTDALLTAINTGQIWAAALDVTDPEPLPRDHPLLRRPNVTITSHIGSATLQTRHRMAELAVENLLRGLAGVPLVTQVG